MLMSLLAPFFAGGGLKAQGRQSWGPSVWRQKEEGGGGGEGNKTTGGDSQNCAVVNREWATRKISYPGVRQSEGFPSLGKGKVL